MAKENKKSNASQIWVCNTSFFERFFSVPDYIKDGVGVSSAEKYKDVLEKLKKENDKDKKITPQ